MGRRGPAPGKGGRPQKPLVEKVRDGNPGKRKLTVVEFPNTTNYRVTSAFARELLSARRKRCRSLEAAEIYVTLWGLARPAVARQGSFSPQLLETICHERRALDPVRGSGD